MDYLFFSTLKHAACVEQIVTSYDIVCQWAVHIWRRMKQYPSYVRLDPHGKKQFVFLIPKFHLPAHVEYCHYTFSFNFAKWCARTDGEAVERGWAGMNPLAGSVVEMGPGSRRDTMDDHFGDWNWKKMFLMGKCLSLMILSDADK